VKHAAIDLQSAQCYQDIMTDEVVKIVRCGSCGQAFDTDELLQSCLACGGATRTFDVIVSASVTVNAGLAFKHFGLGRRKPLTQGFARREWSNKASGYVDRELRIDRQNDQYREVVKDCQTGTELHRCEEKLTEHVGHGSAKRT
jgi:predicted  nucleic acid-binding Zn-ribbon protein